MIVKPHTKIKHKILESYFTICRAVGKKLGKLNYVDLYAGDGEAECDEIQPSKWKAPFIIGLLDQAEKENLNLECYLNDNNLEMYKKLIENIKPYSKYIKQIENKDANKIYLDILRMFDPTEWSIFFLDPHAHSELDFKTIEGISKHKGYFYGTCRQPELIITLMTVGMQRNMEKNEVEINKSLGIQDSSEWKGRINHGEKSYEVFLDIFLRRLKDLGYSAIYFSIEQTRPNRAHLYYMIFASNRPKALEIMSKRFAPYIKKIMGEKWIKENYSFRLTTRARKKGIKVLSDFF